MLINYMSLRRDTSQNFTWHTLGSLNMNRVIHNLAFWPTTAKGVWVRPYDYIDDRVDGVVLDALHSKIIENKTLPVTILVMGK